MKICIIGLFSGNDDEGFKNVASNLAHSLEGEHRVLRADVKTVLTRGFWRELASFRPDIVHYVTAPTLSSLLVLRAAKIRCGAKAVASAIHENGMRLVANPVARAATRLLLPDVVFVQSQASEEAWKALGCRTRQIPNGVDTARFVPVEPGRRSELRRKYGLDPSTFLALHVGHVNPRRGLGICSAIRRRDADVGILVIGSDHFTTDPSVVAALERDGCRVWVRYFREIEEIYQMADVYIFPRCDSILLPLSVLEALSCNIPVISFRNDALMEHLPQKDGLFYYSDEEELLRWIALLKDGACRIRTRDQVLGCSWNAIARGVTACYRDLIGRP